MTSKKVGRAWPTPANPTQAHVIERARFCLRAGEAQSISLTEISRAANHSPSTLIYQFGSWAGLRDSMFVDIVLELASEVRARVDPESGPLAPQLADALLAWVRAEPAAAEFMIGHTPVDLVTSVSLRSATPLSELAGMLLPSLETAVAGLESSHSVVHQSVNAAACLLRATDDSGSAASYVDQLLAATDHAMVLIHDIRTTA